MTNRYGLDDDCDALPHIETPGVCNRCGTTLTGRRTQWCSDGCQDVMRREHDWNAARYAALQRDHHCCVRCGGDGREQRAQRWEHVTSAWTLQRLGIHIPAGEHVLVAHLRHPWLEVNHIDPRVGRGYGWGCWNHSANLETLCHAHHVDETRRQAADRRGVNPQLQLSLLDEVSRG